MLEWFDSHPARYWALAWSVFGLLAVTSLGALFASLLGPRIREWSPRLAPRWVFLVLLVASFGVFRWPALFVNEELNPDESQIIAGAITLQHDPLFWRSVDGTTHGPLDDYALLLARLAGLPLDYFSARLIGGLLVLAAVIALYFLLARKFPEPLARAACLPAFCFFAFNAHSDLVHYSSEHVPVFLLTLGAFFLAADLDAGRCSWRGLAGAAVLGAAPLAKLQSTPISAALLFAAATLEFVTPGRSWDRRFRRLGGLGVATVSLPVLYAVILLLAGEATHAWNSYIVQNLLYAGDQYLSREQMLRTFWQYAGTDPGFFAFAAGAAVFLPLAALRLPVLGARPWRQLALPLAFLAASFLAVLAPGRQYTHYLLMLAVPIGLLAGLLFALWWESLRAEANEGRVLLFAAFVGCLVWPQIQSRFSNPHPYLGKLTAYAQAAPDPVAQEILRHARPGEAMGHWGWMCRYYVLTGLRQATREAHTERAIHSSSQQGYFRARYLSDLAQSQPPVFIDSVGPASFVFKDRASDAHESFPALRDYIAGHYRQVADINGTRIYVRNDRIAQP